MQRLAEVIWQSLGNPAAVEAAWADEIRQRIAAADSELTPFATGGRLAS